MKRLLINSTGFYNLIYFSFIDKFLYINKMNGIDDQDTAAIE